MIGQPPLPLNLGELSNFSAEELATAWRSHLGGNPPEALPKSLLARLLAYRVQVSLHGDLKPATRRLLERIAKGNEAGRKPDLSAGQAFRLKPGTVLVREHGGIEHRVMVLADGYAWKGEMHKSLSAVATAITGTRWNGHRFFGLDRRGAGRTKPPDARKAPSARTGPAPVPGEAHEPVAYRHIELALRS